jgi:hypothetical protein
VVEEYQLVRRGSAEIQSFNSSPPARLSVRRRLISNDYQVYLPWLHKAISGEERISRWKTQKCPLLPQGARLDFYGQWQSELLNVYNHNLLFDFNRKITMYFVSARTSPTSPLWASTALDPSNRKTNHGIVS